jgi:hypothetical protein
LKVSLSARESRYGCFTKLEGLLGIDEHPDTYTQTSVRILYKQENTTSHNEMIHVKNSISKK